MLPPDDSVSNSPALDALLATSMAFSGALDAGDLSRLRGLLAPECEFVEDGASVRGADAVVELLRVAVRWSERSFDDVRPTSTVGFANESSVEVAVTILWMRVPGRWHRLHCERSLEFGADGRVARLTMRCDAGAGRAFCEFARASGAPPVPRGFGIPTED